MLTLGRSRRSSNGWQGTTRFRFGDTVIMEGRKKTLTDALAQLGCLPLAERHLALGSRPTKMLSIAILAATMILVAFRLVPAEAAFFAAAVLVVLFRILTPQQAYDAIDWPIVVMLGCLIPRRGSEGYWRDGDRWARPGCRGPDMPGPVAVGFMLTVAMLVTPFLHDAAAVLVM